MKALIKEAPVPEGVCTNENGVSEENTHTDSFRSLPQGLCREVPVFAVLYTLPSPPGGLFVKICFLHSHSPLRQCVPALWSGAGEVAPNGFTTIWDTAILAESIAALHVSQEDGEMAVLGPPSFRFPPLNSEVPASSHPHSLSFIL